MFKLKSLVKSIRMIETGAYLKLTGFVELFFLCYSRYETENWMCKLCIFHNNVDNCMVSITFKEQRTLKRKFHAVRLSILGMIMSDNKDNLVLYGIS